MLPERLRGTATAVTGDTLTIAGTEVRLAGVRAPHGRTEVFAAPYASAARDILARLLAGHMVSARAIPAAEDRTGRLRAHVLRDDGLWLQSELLKRGAVRVSLSADTAEFGDELLEIEADAREAGHGLWRLDAYAVRDATDLARLNRDVGTYQIIAGTVTSTARRGDDMYLNFGDDYRSDMTAIIPREVWSAFRSLKPLSLTGQRVQVRGWLMRRNGPAVELTAPALLELLE
jgi:endonuclease YncB( thermonuclease family)